MFETPNAVQLRISIDGVKPEAWRRLIVPAEWTLSQLHLVIQAAFNWWNYHLHEFRIGGLRFGDLEIENEFADDDSQRLLDHNEVRLKDFDRGAKRFLYVYDFGDEWRHSVAFEKWLFLTPSPRAATCIAGGGARPPEDVGGVPGYERFLEIIADRKHPEHRDTLRWCGGHFDPTWFDLVVVDKDVRAALKPNVRRRLHQPRPTKNTK